MATKKEIIPIQDMIRMIIFRDNIRESLDLLKYGFANNDLSTAKARKNYNNTIEDVEFYLDRLRGITREYDYLGFREYFKNHHTENDEDEMCAEFCTEFELCIESNIKVAKKRLKKAIKKYKKK
jgi:hypothetical protein